MADAGGEARWLVVAATSRGAGRRYAERAGLHDALVVDRYDVVRSRLRLDRLAPDATHICLHTLDWSRQLGPQLYLVAVARSGARVVRFVDEKRGSSETLTRGALRRRLLRLPPQAVDGAVALTGAVGHELVRRRAESAPEPGRTPRSVVALWLGSVGSPVGGSVTHISGILRGLRERGLRTGLVTAVEPPAQLTAVVDEVRVVSPLRAGRRAASPLASLASNAPLRDAVEGLVDDLGADVVYQRHAPFLSAGLDAARARGAALVLEWNASEHWAFTNWSNSPFRGGAMGRLLGSMERRVARGATLIAAVSSAARDMAEAAGAHPERTMTLPNAVDLAEIDAILQERADEPSRDGRRLVGWVGSFGVWHGADVLIAALADLDAETEAVLIGDGPERAACEELAIRLGVAERVTWAGQAEHRRAVELLAGCDVLVSPTVPLRGEQRFFGSPTKIFEYMAIGKPIVASRLGQIAEVLEDGRTAKLVTPGDPGELGRAVESVRRAPENSAARARAARAEVERSHTWSRRAADLIARLEGD